MKHRPESRWALFLVLEASLTESALAAIATSPSYASTGMAVFVHWCAPCLARVPGHPGTQSLQVKYAGKLPAVLARTEPTCHRRPSRYSCARGSY